MPERPIPEEWTHETARGLGAYRRSPDLPYCPLCGNVNRADLGPVTGMCLDGRACRRRQAGVELANPDERPMPEEWVYETARGIEDWRPTDA